MSKRTELGILSNFAATPFTLDGARFGSVEGFWQSLKYPEDPQDERSKFSKSWPHTRDEVAKMTAFEAKEAGNRANAILKEIGVDWVTYRGTKLHPLENKDGAFYELIIRAERAKLAENPEVKRILLQTRGLILRPDHHQPADAPPAYRYYDIWMKIRSELVSLK